ncbi:MAG: DNA helicase rad5 [Geoglossum umbratile]|nr:MAG: DNA helicase rad5 [Geoglossum umbratile]
MDYPDAELPPAKKRRFFSELSPASDQPFQPQPSLPDHPDLPDPPSSLRIPVVEDVQRQEVAVPDAISENASYSGFSPGGPQVFDIGLFESVVGVEVASETLRRIREAAGGDTERAINMYFDGSWRTASTVIVPRPMPEPENMTNSPVASPSPQQRNTGIVEAANSIPTPRIRVRLRDAVPDSRYVGAFGVGAWVTRPANIIKHGEQVRIERQKLLPKASASNRGGRGKGGAALTSRASNFNRRVDIIVRFTNSKDEEIGRLPKETAAWVSTLIDQKICKFDGTCVFVPERVRTNDTIYLQLRCYLLRSAFDTRRFRPADNNRSTGIFETKETEEEKDMRLLQIALVKLFEEINLHPSKSNEATEKHKREQLLRAAEDVDQHEREDTSKKPKPEENGDPTPPGSDEPEEGKELEQDQLDMLYKKAQSFDFNTPEAEPADTFAMDLRPYQKQALHWMLEKERDEKAEHKQESMHPLWEDYSFPTKDADDRELPEAVHHKFYVNPYSGELSLDFPTQDQHCLGGILADEMGLGKTIEMLSLIHTNKSDVALQLQSPSSVPISISSLPRLPKRSASVEQAPCTTLVVAPMSLLAQWHSEAENASKPGTLKAIVYYGNDKAANLRNLCCEANAASAPNLVITSYGIVLSEFNQAIVSGDRNSHDGLFSLNFFRVILDEAHYVKNRQSKTAKACYEIGAEHRWVLTGTPIVNRLEDLFSLIRFLRVEPWANFSFWKTFITVPFESKEFIRALDVVQTVLEPLVLRRTKDMKTPDGQSLVPLPPRTIQIEEVELSKPEREVYNHIYNRAKRTFAENIQAGTLLKSYTTIFAQILRLRQSCCHPILTRNKDIVADEEEATAAADTASGLADDMDLQELIARFTADEGEKDANAFGASVMKQIQEEANNECPICAEEPMVDQAVTGCWHSACKKCLLDYIEHQKDKGNLPRCFQCREPINQRDVFEVVKHDDGAGPSGQSRISLRRVNANNSAKIGALVKHLKRLRREEPRMKSVVFSQFTSFLDLIEPALERDNISFLRFDGSMAQKARAAVLGEFASRPKAVVLLLSLRAGGVGLNLTQAKRVFMMDPWWSFAVEAQAIDRVHRMGQEDSVTVYRFIVKDSVEHRMLKIQDRKKFM